MVITKFDEYKILDMAHGEKVESWNGVILRRPDPQAIWKVDKKTNEWKDVAGHYHRSSSGGGSWEFKKSLKDSWTVNYKALTFKVAPTSFKHTGLFPEQAVNWDWFSNLIKGENRKIKVLNLFAYTGGASVAALNAGADVVHVDASKGMVSWAKENVISSGLGDRCIRYIVDDVKKFVKREIRRGNKYDAIIMDPPSYGRGPGGEVWKIEDELYPLIQDCISIMSDNPLFFLINSYTTGLSACILENVLSMTVKRQFGGTVTADEIGLPMRASGMPLPCGISGRWENK